MEENLKEDKESIKLSKMSKGYNWEIKLKEETVGDETIKRLKHLNEILSKDYGS